jgi:hypothetical protein
MNRISALLLIFMISACNEQIPERRAPVTLAQPPFAPTPPVVVVDSERDVAIGDTVEGVIGDGVSTRPGQHHFWLKVPQAGTLTATLTWDPFYLGTLLELTADGQKSTPVSRPWSPVIGRIPVEPGIRYLIIVSVSGADWFPHDRFTLTTRLDPSGL